MDDDLPDSPVPPRGLMGDCRFSVEILAWDLVATKIEGEERVGSFSQKATWMLCHMEEMSLRDFVLSIFNMSLDGQFSK